MWRNVSLPYTSPPQDGGKNKYSHSWNAHNNNNQIKRQKHVPTWKCDSKCFTDQEKQIHSISGQKIVKIGYQTRRWMLNVHNH